MKSRSLAAAAGAALVVTAAALAQVPGQGVPPRGAATTAAPPPAAQQATVETADVSVIYPDRYAVPVVLEPNRRIFVTAPADGILKSVATPVGATVREAQEIAQMDRSEATVKAKIAEAEVAEARAQVEKSKSGSADLGVAKARLDAAEARSELAKIELDRCVLRAPFGGKVIAAPVSPGQNVTKGTALAELADYSVMKVLVPVDRTAVKVGDEIEVTIEGQPVKAKVTATVPLPETYGAVRELAIPWAAAWATVPNADGAREPGLRVRSPYLPTQPITAVPSRAVREAADGSGSLVQIIRFNHVVDVPVKVIGDAGFDRTQVSGTFLPTDAAIVESSLPMASGTVIRFNGEPPVTGLAGANTGSVIEFTPPVGGPVHVGGGGNRVAPLGSPNANTSTRKGRPAAGKAATKGTNTQKAAGASGSPF